MRIGYLIEKLEQLKEEHGDIDVTSKIWNDWLGVYSYEEVKDVDVMADLDREGDKVVNLIF